MGLTVHFKLAAPAAVTAAEARKLVESMRRIAGRFHMEGLVDRVHPITSDAKILRRFATDYLILPMSAEEKTSTWADVFPTAGFLFEVEVGADCEPLQLGLCQYPSTVRFQGREVRTRKGTGWRLASFSKTQFASLNGWEHFLRCHCAVVNLLAACRTPERRVKISDEGDYWPRRSLAKLRGNLDQMNGLVAAAAGALRDAEETEAGKNLVQSPMFAHKNFERLEAEGAQRIGVALEKMQEIIRKL